MKATDRLLGIAGWPRSGTSARVILGVTGMVVTVRLVKLPRDVHAYYDLRLVRDCTARHVVVGRGTWVYRGDDVFGL